jgi:hypothetical protein
MYSGRDLCAPDLTLFLHELKGIERTFERSLQESLKGEILEQLRKASWTCDQVERIAEIVAHHTKQRAEYVLRRFDDLALMHNYNGYRLTARDIDYLYSREPLT